MARYQHLNQMQQQRPCFPIQMMFFPGLVKTKTSLITSSAVVAPNNGQITLNMTLSEAMKGLCNNDGVVICLVRGGFMTGH